MKEVNGEKSGDTTTEERIKQVARSIFYQKGYAATRTRDIAVEANINLALLNYYYRSKEKLFHIIMVETVYEFIEQMGVIMNEEKTSLEKKVEMMASTYIDFVIKEPHVPIFILSELRNDASKLLDKLPVKELFVNSVFYRQYNEYVSEGKIAQPNSFHFFMNLMSLIVFPFVTSPILKSIGGESDDQFIQLMMERKRMIPLWISAMMKI
ncbi:MAG: TetR/AcrR family transcriptional regulator [Bacteroidales bacterium]|nr:TetR/AcrR family transcriptional regulator [Bacteroidales bacterium]